jgi:hypothetical protein
VQLRHFQTHRLGNAVPVRSSHHRLGTSLEYSNDRGYARLAYDGSFFRNNVTTLVFDNPGRVSDSPTAGPVQGRMALWPNTEMNTVSASGGLKLPGHSRATAYISVGNMSNNAALLPFTINTALVSPALDRPTADISARVTAMNYLFTSRPVNTVWFSARYRQYEMGQPHGAVQGEQQRELRHGNRRAEPVERAFQPDAPHVRRRRRPTSPVRHVGLPGRLHRARRSTAPIESSRSTTEDIGPCAPVDLTGLPFLSVRGVFEHGKRRGTPVDGLELLGDRRTAACCGSTTSPIATRIASRRSSWSRRCRSSQVNSLDIVRPPGVPRDDLRAAEQRQPGLLARVRLCSLATRSRWASPTGSRKYTALQASRTANPLPANTVAFLNDPTQQFNDPRRDWTDDSADRVHTVDASFDLIKLITRTDIKVAYSYSRAESTYTYGLAPNTVIAAPVQLSPVLNELQRGTVDGRYFLTRHFAVGLLYWLDKYRVDDFALSPVSSLAQPANSASPTLMMLGYFYRPYTANTVMARMTYLW